MTTMLLCLTVTMAFVILTHGLETTDPKCPDGWSLYREGKTCIKVSNGQTRLSWKDARMECQSNGGDLAKIADTGMRDFVKDAISGRNKYWIGLHDPHNDGTFQWLDEQQQTSFEWWNCREPNNQGGNERCVEIFASRNGRWNDKACHRKQPFICQTGVQEQNVELPAPERVARTYDSRMLNKFLNLDEK